MDDKAKIFSDLLADLQLSELRSIRNLITGEISKLEPVQDRGFLDAAGIDSPVELVSNKNGEIQIRSAIEIGGENVWRYISLSKTAQFELLEILIAQISEGGKVKSIQLAKKTLQ